MNLIALITCLYVIGIIATYITYIEAFDGDMEVRIPFVNKYRDVEEPWVMILVMFLWPIYWTLVALAIGFMWAQIAWNKITHKDNHK